VEYTIFEIFHWTHQQHCAGIRLLEELAWI